MRNTKALILAALLAAVLAGCGGGGDGKGPGNAGNPGNAGTGNTTGPDLQNSVPAPTYAVGSQEQDAWNVLQGARSTCGFGLLQQDARLDAATKAHANYLTLNPTYGLSAHEEIAGKQGFTGASLGSRIMAQGFKGAASEIIAFEESGHESMIGLLTVPYHGMTALGAWRSVGLGFGKDVLVVNPGTETQWQRLGAGVVVNYPCEGAANVDTSWSGEVPDPFPDMGSERGTPIMLRSDPGSTLKIMNFAVLREANGQSETFRTLTSDNDRNRIIGANEFVAVPLGALAHNETYRVSYSATLNGSPIQKTFTFKTRPKPRQIIMCRNPYTGETYRCYEDTLARV